MAVTITAPTTSVANTLFAFNHNTFKITGLASGEQVSVTITTSGVTYTDTRNADTDGACSIEVSAYLQSLFCRQNSREPNVQDDFQTSISSTISITSEGGATGTYNYTIIYGALNYGETYTAYTSNLHLWGAYPSARQTFVFNNNTGYTSGWSLNTQNLDGTTGSESITLYEGYNVLRPVTLLSQRGLLHADTMGIYLTNSSARYSLTFDLCMCDGVLLRWVDRMGNWQYWLFEKGDETITTANYGEEIDTPYRASNLSLYGSRRQGKSIGTQIACCQPLCDRSMFDFLCGIMGSPHVSWFDGKSQAWIPVQVSADKSTWARDQHAQLQDFTLSIVLPETLTQRL